MCCLLLPPEIDLMVNRRDFLKRSAVLGAATPLAGQERNASKPGKLRFTHTANVVVLGIPDVL
jgi:hypothetical protein